MHHFGDHDSEMNLNCSNFGIQRVAPRQWESHSQRMRREFAACGIQPFEVPWSTERNGRINTITYNYIQYTDILWRFMTFSWYLKDIYWDVQQTIFDYIFIHSLSLSRWWLEGNKRKRLGCRKSPSTVGNSTDEVLPFQDAQGRSQVPKNTIFRCEFLERPVTFNPKYVVF